MPKVAAIVAREAPGVTLELLPTERLRYPLLLEAGDLDFALGAVLTPAPGLRRSKLYSERFACAVRKNHPRLRGKKLSLPTYAALDHILIAIGEGSGPTWVDDQLRIRALKRRIVVRTRSFLAAALLVAESDMILTGPRRLCEWMARRHGLTLFDPPIELPAYEEEVLWHERFDDDPAHRWLRDVLARVSRKL
jgi:DNA-binding transcriptional LysR family regulator